MRLAALALGIVFVAPVQTLAQVPGSRWDEAAKRIVPLPSQVRPAAPLAPTGLASTFRPGMCLDIRGGGADAILWPCHGGANQQFAFLNGSSGHLGVMGACLSTSGREGASLIAAPCQNVPAQRWSLKGNGALTNAQGWCADVEQRGGQGARVIAWRCMNDAPNQRWRMAPFQQPRR